MVDQKDRCFRLMMVIIMIIITNNIFYTSYYIPGPVIHSQMYSHFIFTTTL